MSNTLKIILIIAGIILAIIVILAILGSRRLKNEKKKDEKLEALINNGAYVHAKCLIQSDIIYTDRFALHDSQRKHLEYLDSLLALCNRKIEDENINEKEKVFSFFAQQIPDIDYAGLLHFIDYCKPDINYQNAKGETLLHVACRSNKHLLAKLLIEKEAKTNIADNDGTTPLIIACKQGNYDVVKLLLENGADVNKTDKSGKNIIQLVNTDSDKYVDIVALLVEHGAQKE